jgi:hypothetical protein
MQYTKRIIVNKYELVLAYSIKWKSYPGDDGKYYESEEVKYIKFGLANRMMKAESEDNYRGFTLLGLDVGIGHKKRTEQII